MAATPNKPGQKGEPHKSLYTARSNQHKPARWQSQRFPFLGRLVASGALMLLALLAFNLLFE
ncbi:MAG: hypothetical protein Alpg2KO_15540 [Alphaproteobacteria bacterium]